MNPHQFRLSHSSYLLILVFVLQTAAGGVGPVPGPDVSLLILRHIVDFWWRTARGLLGFLSFFFFFFFSFFSFPLQWKRTNTRYKWDILHSSQCWLTNWRQLLVWIKTPVSKMESERSSAQQAQTVGFSHHTWWSGGEKKKKKKEKGKKRESCQLNVQHEMQMCWEQSRHNPADLPAVPADAIWSTREPR